MLTMIGTKLHQATWAAITKRKPALLSAIKKYNQYCDVLCKSALANCPVPILKLLPLELNALRDIETSGLMEDVWITPSSHSQLPRWLEDLDIRHGIKALLKSDQCKEERERLAIETNSMCRWFGNKLACIEVALCLPECKLPLSYLP